MTDNPLQDGTWNPERLAHACDAIQEAHRKGAPLLDDDPRRAYVLSALQAGHWLMESLLTQPDGASVVDAIDQLPDDSLRLIVLALAEKVGRARADS